MVIKYILSANLVTPYLLMVTSLYPCRIQFGSVDLATGVVRIFRLQMCFVKTLVHLGRFSFPFLLHSNTSSQLSKLEIILCNARPSIHHQAVHRVEGVSFLFHVAYKFFGLAKSGNDASRPAPNAE